jgi:hypothetical protein
LALEFVELLQRAHVADAEDRKQAREAAAACARNVAE